MLTGIIDIGSNSIRLVVYRGALRTPPTIFNEKVMAGLGRGVAANGLISEEGMTLALTTLGRFAMLAEDMGVERMTCVATAAVREAANRDEFVARVAGKCGLKVDVISGESEARFAALGVISGIPGANGVVGDLGGGSLELIRVVDGQPQQRTSLPIGSLKLDAARGKGARSLSRFINRALDDIEWADAAQGLPFYTVGGSWRALSQLHMWLTGYPLPVVHQYAMESRAPDYLARALAHMDLRGLRQVPNLSSNRIPSLPAAATLLREVTERLRSSEIIASAYGLREGLLYAGLSADRRRDDPLIAAARAEGRYQGRFPEHGDALMQWMNGLFVTESNGDARIRLAACLLADVAWRAHPDFRAERALDVALHGNWVGITARERAMLGATLFACFGGSENDPAIAILPRLADQPSLATARAWGLALRLGQRLTGGTAQPLADSRLQREDGLLVLTLREAHAALFGETVMRRLKSLAQLLGLKSECRISR